MYSGAFLIAPGRIFGAGTLLQSKVTAPSQPALGWCLVCYLYLPSPVDLDGLCIIYVYAYVTLILAPFLNSSCAAALCQYCKFGLTFCHRSGDGENIGIGCILG
jgi:hypothetical protein